MENGVEGAWGLMEGMKSIESFMNPRGPRNPQIMTSWGGVLPTRSRPWWGWSDPSDGEELAPSGSAVRREALTAVRDTALPGRWVGCWLRGASPSSS